MLIETKFTVEQAQNAYDALTDMFEGLPKSKRTDYLGNLNEIGVFIANIKKAIEEATKK